MTDNATFILKTEPADFSVLLSSIFTVSREMGLNMERTARAPIYFSAHDFTTAILNLDCEMLPGQCGTILKMRLMREMSFW